jgi:hypothetical protein
MGSKFPGRADGRTTFGQAVLVFLAVGLVIGVASIWALVWQSSVQETFPTAREATRELDAARQRFGSARPYIEVVRMGGQAETVVHHDAEPSQPAPIITLRGIAWDPASRRLVRASTPYWAYKLSLAKARVVQRLVGDFDGRLGIDLTLPELEPLGPGLVLDLRDPDGGRIIVWAE